MSPTPSYYHSARRQALAERHRPRADVVETPGGRLHGCCSNCLGIHRSPDMRWACPDCPVSLCLEEARAAGFTCPECGSRLELGDKEAEP